MLINIGEQVSSTRPLEVRGICAQANLQIETLSAQEAVDKRSDLFRKSASPRQRGIQEGTNLVPVEKLCPFFPSKIKMRHHTEPTLIFDVLSVFPVVPVSKENQLRHRSLKEPSSLNFLNHRQRQLLLWIGKSTVYHIERKQLK